MKRKEIRARFVRESDTIFEKYYSPSWRNRGSAGGSGGWDVCPGIKLGTGVATAVTVIINLC